MGDIVCKVKLAALTSEGVAGSAREYTSYVDTGASKTIISSKIAKELGGSHLGIIIPIAGFATRAKLIAVQLECKNCPLLPVVVAISDELVARIGEPGVEVIVGQDYLQGGRAKISMRLSVEGKDAVRCAPARAPTSPRPAPRRAKAG